MITPSPIYSIQYSMNVNFSTILYSWMPKTVYEYPSSNNVFSGRIQIITIFVKPQYNLSGYCSKVWVAYCVISHLFDGVGKITLDMFGTQGSLLVIFKEISYIMKVVCCRVWKEERYILNCGSLQRVTE